MLTSTASFSRSQFRWRRNYKFFVFHLSSLVLLVPRPAVVIPQDHTNAAADAAETAHQAVSKPVKQSFVSSDGLPTKFGKVVVSRQPRRQTNLMAPSDSHTRLQLVETNLRFGPIFGFTSYTYHSLETSIQEDLSWSPIIMAPDSTELYSSLKS